MHPTNNKNYIAFVAGSGITPVLSIIKTILLTEPASSVTLVYGNRNRNAIIFKEELETLKNKFINRLNIIHILSREKTDSPLQDGRIDAEKCRMIFQHVVDINSCDEFFLCGPGEMIFTVQQYLLDKNIPASKIHFELFTPPGGRQPLVQSREPAGVNDLQGKISRVTVKSDGISFDFDLPYEGQSVLDAALNRGADLPFACKGGVCASCRARLTGGSVEMVTNYALEPEEIKKGYVLTCQSHPRSEHISIDFDNI